MKRFIAISLLMATTVLPAAACIWDDTDNYYLFRAYNSREFRGYVDEVTSNNWKVYLGSQEPYYYFDADEVIVEKPGATVLSGFGDRIEFHNVSFSYGGKQEDRESPAMVLKNIKLVVPKGKTIAIVGPSGAGKTTLVDEGFISVDGHPIRDLNINSLRAQFGLVSQNCILFNDTVANNIAFGAENYSVEAIREAARVAHADEFIDQLPQGYDTSIGDRGLNLSGGQRQRLSIARAVLRDTPILLLDEATSALDAESERAVQQGLDALMQGRTSIVIAHRLSTIRHADLIVVLDHGEIVEQGTHEELLSHDGLYKKLVDMQSFA